MTSLVSVPSREVTPSADLGCSCLFEFRDPMVGSCLGSPPPSKPPGECLRVPSHLSLGFCQQFVLTHLCPHPPTRTAEWSHFQSRWSRRRLGPWQGFVTPRSASGSWGPHVAFPCPSIRGHTGCAQAQMRTERERPCRVTLTPKLLLSLPLSGAGDLRVCPNAG